MGGDNLQPMLDFWGMLPVYDVSDEFVLIRVVGTKIDGVGRRNTINVPPNDWAPQLFKSALRKAYSAIQSVRLESPQVLSVSRYKTSLPWIVAAQLAWLDGCITPFQQPLGTLEV